MAAQHTAFSTFTGNQKLAKLKGNIGSSKRMYFLNEDKRMKERLFKRIGREFDFEKVMPGAKLKQ
jgi:hypothetical protein